MATSSVSRRRAPPLTPTSSKPLHLLTPTQPSPTPDASLDGPLQRLKGGGHHRACAPQRLVLGLCGLARAPAPRPRVPKLHLALEQLRACATDPGHLRARAGWGMWFGVRVGVRGTGLTLRLESCTAADPLDGKEGGWATRVGVSAAAPTATSKQARCSTVQDLVRVAGRAGWGERLCLQ